MSRIDLVHWASRFIATPSVSRAGNREIAELAAELARSVGLEPRLVPTVIDGVEHVTLLADLGPPGAPGLLLLTHLDTVPPGDRALWTQTGGDPYRPVRDGDRLYGLGSADAKVDLVCKLAALAELDAPLARRVRVVGTFGEEIGLLGARELVRSGATQGYRFALVGEPSELACIHAHKGYRVYELEVPLESAFGARGGSLESATFSGRAAHSSAPELGQNAIELALERLARRDVLGVIALEGGEATNIVPARCEATFMKAHEQAGPKAAQVHDARPLASLHAAWHRLRERLAEQKDASFDPDHSVASLGRIELEPGRVLARFDLRPVPASDPSAALEELSKLFKLRCVRENPPLRTPLSSPLMRAVADAQARAGLPVAMGTKATCTEAGVLSEAGLDACVLGPGISVGNVHRPNEHTLVSQLEQARDVYREVVSRLCGER